MSKGLQKTCKELRVITVEAQEAIWLLAPRDWIGKRKAAIAKVARDLGWKFSRTWNIAHGRARIIHAEEMDSLRLRLARLDQLKAQGNAARERHNELIYLRHELARAIRPSTQGAGAGVDALQQAAGESDQAGGRAGPRHSTKTSFG
jgi:hypothetical protein